MFGYVTFRGNSSATRAKVVPDLYFMGAEHVFTDMAQGNVRNREGFRLLCKVMRKGDCLLIDRPQSFGTKPEYQTRNLARIERMGVEVMELTLDAKAMRLAA